MSFNFGSLFTTVENAVESLIAILVGETQTVGKSASAIVTEAAPVIDEIGGTGTAAKVTHEVGSATQAAIAVVTPYLQDATAAAEVVKGVATVFASHAAQAAQQAAPTAQPAA